MGQPTGLVRCPGEGEGSRVRRVAAVLLWLVGSGTLVSAQYVPPPGIPKPSFGVDEVAPAPICWVNAATGSDANTCLVEALPRATIPRSLGAGAVVKVTGTQTFDYEGSGGRIHMAGTLANPVWIVSDAATPMAFTQLLEVDGTYFIWEGGSGKGIIVTDSTAGAATHHAAIRATNQTGPSYVFSGLGGEVSEIVWKGNILHETGNIYAGEAGGDQHCIKINVAHNVYVLGNLMYLCNGDGVQVGDVAHSGQTTTYFEYLGGNICLANRQTCLWAKNSSGVVMTSNVCAYARSIPEPSPPAAPNTYLNPSSCYGAQYGSLYLTIMQNLATRADTGIRIGGFDARGTSINIFGNTIYDIHSSIGPGAGGVDYGGAFGNAIAIAGDGGDIVVANNTIYSTDGGIGSTPGIGSLLYFNNTFSLTGHHDVQWDTAAPTLTYNNYDNAAILHPATSNFNTIIGDPLFTSAPTGVFTLQAASPILHTGFAWDVNTPYMALHGVTTGVTYASVPNMGASQVDPTTPAPHRVSPRRRFR
jgi:hypothetical protein